MDMMAPKNLLQKSNRLQFDYEKLAKLHGDSDKQYNTLNPLASSSQIQHTANHCVLFASATAGNRMYSTFPPHNDPVLTSVSGGGHSVGQISHHVSLVYTASVHTIEISHHVSLV